MQCGVRICVCECVALGLHIAGRVCVFECVCLSVCVCVCVLHLRCTSLEECVWWSVCGCVCVCVCHPPIHVPVDGSRFSNQISKEYLDFSIRFPSFVFPMSA